VSFVIILLFALLIPFRTIWSINTYPAPNWIPILAFNRTNADVSLFFLAFNSVTYSYSSTDPIFKATILVNVTETDGTIFGYYVSDYFINVLGCTDQFQICNPNIPGLDGEPTRCTALSSYLVLYNEVDAIGLNDYQVATSDTLILSMGFSNMYDAVNGRGSSALNAQNTVFNLNQAAALPNNQWQIELSGWFAVSLATFQQALVEYASGPTNVVNQRGTITSPSDEYGQAVCMRQMIRNVSGYQNFSTLGIAIILIVGTSLVTRGWTIDIIVGAIEKRKGRHFSRLSWISDGYLQLQRLAYEGAGYNNWVSCADDVPVSRGLGAADRQVGGLDIDDLDHPQLVRSACQAPQAPQASASASAFDEASTENGTELQPLIPQGESAVPNGGCGA
jgi:hypothetical protein